MLTYKEILKISTPIMIGSAVQNVLTLTDLIFLGRVGEVELGAIGIVGIFYLILSAIGYCFSRGGQIMIARRIGEGRLTEVGKATWSLLAFEMSLATVMFFAAKLGAPLLFGTFLKSEAIYQKCIEYLDYRLPALFFSYFAVTIMAFYTGISRTTVIIYNAAVMGILNVFLNYALVFGHWGAPEMGMGGAALASTIAEAVATVVFIVYMIMDRQNLRQYALWGRPHDAEEPLIEQVMDAMPADQIKSIDWNTILVQLKLSSPIMIQSVVGQGSWLIFFMVVESMGERQLAISNLLRAVYMVFMIPGMGLASGINTIVSTLMGQGNIQAVLPTVRRASILSMVITMLLALSLWIVPEWVLWIGTTDHSLIQETLPLVWVLAVALLFYSGSAIYFNGLCGTGATGMGLNLQLISAFAYLGYIYVAVSILHCSLSVAWMSELVYWIVLFLLSLGYLKGSRWHDIRV